MIKLSGSILFCFVSLAIVQAADWPQYKLDAARSANAAGDSLTFPLRRVMAVKFSSPIYASAAIVGNKVYAVDERGLLACIDKSSNRVLWWAEIGGVSNRSSPAVTNGRVFVGSTAGYLMILDADSGTELARIPAAGGVIAAPAVANNSVYCLSFNGSMLKTDLEGRLIWTYAYPKARAANQEFMVKGDTLVFWAGPYDSVGADGRGEPYAIHIIRDKGDSAGLVEIIRRGAGPSGWDQTPWPQHWIDLGLKDLNGTGCCGGGGVAFVTFAEDRPRTKSCFVGNPFTNTSSFRPSAAGDVNGNINFYNLTGSGLKWSYATSRTGLPNGGVTATASIAGGVAYVGGEDGILYGLGQGSADAAIISVVPDTVYGRPGERLSGHEWPTAGGDMSYAAVSPDTLIKPPLKVYWKTRVAGVGGYINVTVAAGKVFTASSTGFLEALDAETGEILWRTCHLGSFGSDGPPTYAEGKVLVLRRNGLWCHDARTGSLLWNKPQPRLEGVSAWGAPQADGMVVTQGKVLAAWYEGGDARTGVGDSIITAALDLATGQEVWRVRRDGFFPAVADSVIAIERRVRQGALDNNTWFISGVIVNSRSWSQPIGGTTMAIDPSNGAMKWKTSEYYVKTLMAGVSARNGKVFVFGSNSGGYKTQALDAATGQMLWLSSQPVWHLAPLTDAFLTSQGALRTTRAGYCVDPVWVNGLFFGPNTFSSSNFTARTAANLELWRYVPMSRGCTAPAPAYGRLYYNSNGEGVVYCFHNPATDPMRAAGKPPLHDSRTKIRPNPFNPAACITFYLPEKGKVDVSIYDVRGLFIKRIAGGVMAPGGHRTVWNGTDRLNRKVAAGLYLCRINAAGKIENLKLVFVK